MFTPTTNLRLLSTPLESDYSNTLWFPNVAAQTAYFTGKIVKTFDDFNYIKKDNTIVVAEEIDRLYNCNYIMYKNSNFSTRWFYAFINRMEWASNGSTRLYVSTDVIQTWFFDITYYHSYVDRCHSDSDITGDNIVPEDFSGMGAGGYYQTGSQDLQPNWVSVFATTDFDGNPIPATESSGIISGTGVAVRMATDIQRLSSLVNRYVQNGMATAIAKIQQYPVGNHSAIVTFAKHPSSIDGYIPTNKKLLSGAFLQCYMTMYGQEIDFNPEYIDGNNVSFQIAIDETSGTIGVIVTNYGSSNIANLSMTAVIPESTWAYNQYKNDYNLHNASNSIYIQRQQNLRAGNTAQAVVGSIGSIAGMAGSIIDAVNPVTAVTGRVNQSLQNVTNNASNLITNATNAAIQFSGIDEITQDLTAISENYNAPATGGVATSNMFISSGKTALSYGFKIPPLDIVKRCDKFLSVYGYKQSEYRRINLHARANWTYIRTLGLNASGNFPNDDMKIIKQAFDKGIFFWSYTAQFGNFNQANPIV